MPPPVASSTAATTSQAQGDCDNIPGRTRLVGQLLGSAGGSLVTLLVVLFGLAIVAFGLAGLAAPRRIVDGMLRWESRSRFYFAVGVRLAFGAVLLLAASDCRFSSVIFVLGMVALVVALVLAALGPRRVDSMLQWWLHSPVVALRAWFVAAIPFGAFLVYAGI